MQAPLIDGRWLLSRVGSTRGEDPAADEAIGPQCPVSGPPHGERLLDSTSATAPQRADADAHLEAAA
ncbi:MAG TPA: hypothetical protein VFN79_03115 [Steroidobacteraceae bacterium]|nr:hypothetical protein [Steroidobacteraceae bacterium]